MRDQETIVSNTIPTNDRAGLLLQPAPAKGAAAHPAVSVLMPVRDSQAYVAEAVKSILAQSFGDFEFIIIDDGSRDQTRDILLRFAAQDERIRLYSRESRGLVHSLNEGLAGCRAELIARMDGDDIAHPQRLEKQFHFMQEHPEVVLLGAQVQPIDPFGVPLPLEPFPAEHEEIDQQLLAGNGWMLCHPVAMMRKWAVERVGGYRDVMVEDLDLFLRLAEVGRLANLPEVLLQYRQHLNSWVRTRFFEQQAQIGRIVDEAYHRRGWQSSRRVPLLDRVLLSPAEQSRRWGWSALQHGNIPAARRHARACLRQDPLALETWRLLYCSLRGR